MKVIIAGSRTFKDYDFMMQVCDSILINQDKKELEIVSGTALGADLLGERYAIERTLKLRRFHADWSLGRKAGFIRNKLMGQYADALIAFWDSKTYSNGTRNMIDIALKLKLKVRIQLF